MTALSNLTESNLVRAGVLLEAGAISLDDAAGATGYSDGAAFLDALVPDVLQAVAAEYFKHRLTGKLSETRAMLGLDKLSAKLLADADDPELTTGQALRVGEFLLKLSGMVERRQAEIRTTPNDDRRGVILIEHAPKLRMALIYGNDPRHDTIATIQTTEGTAAAFAYLDSACEEAGNA